MNRKPMTDDAIARVVRTLRELQSGGLALPNLPDTARPDAGLAKEVPPWISHLSLLADGRCAWLFCEPDPGVAHDQPGQVVLDLPAGRYLIDTFDPASRTCVARESAAAPPLVIGLVHTGTPVLLWIRPITDRRPAGG